MEALLMVFDKTSGKTGTADTPTDQLSNKYSVIILGIFALVATTGNYFHQPISCYCPNEFKGSEIEFVEKVCYTQTTYYLNYAEFDTNTQSVSYYQWISLILAGQAFLFYLPSSIWKIMGKKSGLTLSSITDSVKRCRRNLDLEENEKALQFASNTLNNYLHVQNKKTSEGKKKWLIFKGNYLAYLYLFIKFLYCLNAVGQLFILNAFLGDNYHLYGIEFLDNMRNGVTWKSSRKFPKVTFCNVSIFVPFNIHDRFLQCVLPMNLIYEMMFLVIWLWLVFIGIVSCVSMAKWAFQTIRVKKRVEYVTDLLVKSHCLDSCHGDEDEIRKFVCDYLRKDGCFILRMVEANADKWITWRLVGEIWNKYQTKKHLKSKLNKINETCELGANKFI